MGLLCLSFGVVHPLLVGDAHGDGRCSPLILLSLTGEICALILHFNTHTVKQSEPLLLHYY